MKWIKSFYYYFYFKFIKGRIKSVLSQYLNEDSKIEISYLKKCITIKNYKINLIKDELLILNYLNHSFEQFKFDKVKYKLNKVTYSAENIPDTFKINPKNEKTGQITIGETEEGRMIWEPMINSSLALLCPPGTGKTYATRGLLKNIEKYHLGKGKTFEKVMIFDLKQEGDFDFLKQNTSVKIYHTQEEVEKSLIELENKADVNTAQKTLVVAEEYVQLILNGEKKIGKNISRILLKVHTFMRSKGIAILLSSQFITNDENELRLDNFIKIMSSPSESYAKLHHIPMGYTGRNDLRFGKFLISYRGKNQCIRL